MENRRSGFRFEKLLIGEAFRYRTDPLRGGKSALFCVRHAGKPGHAGPVGMAGVAKKILSFPHDHWQAVLRAVEGIGRIPGVSRNPGRGVGCRHYQYCRSFDWSHMPALGSPV